MSVLGENIPIVIKSERVDDSNSPVPNPTANSENDDSLPDYENSMLARSLLSGNIKTLFSLQSVFPIYKSCLIY